MAKRLGLFGEEFSGSEGPQGYDPFWSPEGREQGRAYYDAWRIEDLVRSGELQREGYRPGDSIPVRWEDREGNVRETTVTLPRDWRRHDAWGEFYKDLREFFYPLWEEDTGNEYDHEGGYIGSATAG